MSRDTFLLADPITAQDPERRCLLDLYGGSPHPPHAWAELVGPYEAADHPPAMHLTGYQCPGREGQRGRRFEYEPLRPWGAKARRFLLTDNERQSVHEELMRTVERKMREAMEGVVAPPAGFSFNPYDLIDPASLEAYWPTGEALPNPLRNIPNG